MTQWTAAGPKPATKRLRIAFTVDAQLDPATDVGEAIDQAMEQVMAKHEDLRPGPASITELVHVPGGMVNVQYAWVEGDDVC